MGRRLGLCAAVRQDAVSAFALLTRAVPWDPPMQGKCEAVPKNQQLRHEQSWSGKSEDTVHILAHTAQPSAGLSNPGHMLTDGPPRCEQLAAGTTSPPLML